MRLLLLLVLTLACFAMGPDNPFFFMVGFVLFGWFVVALMAGSVRWLLGLTAPAPNGGSPPTGRASAPSRWNSAPTAQTRLCPDNRCGRVNVGQARFCAQCGRRLA